MHTERFSGKAGDYTKYRPQYPPLLMEILTDKIHLQPDWIIADIGSGTGISSLPFLKNGNLVFAVEPNADMRHAAEAELDFYENFVSVSGTAEHTALNDKSIDLVFCGTAFHWFQFEETRQEFRRILKEDHFVVIAWNTRDLEDAFQNELEDLFNRKTSPIASTEYLKSRNAAEDFFQKGSFHTDSTRFRQAFSFEELLGRLRSSSYFPAEENPLYAEMIQEVYEIFNRYQKDGLVDFCYKTEIYWGKL